LCRSLAAELPRPIVIYDLPPLLIGDDVLKFYPNADCTLFVVSEGQTSRAAVQRAQEVLQEMNLLGVVVNRSSEREESAYY
jgi:Mrp family chromosome partitioning ATPase